MLTLPLSRCLPMTNVHRRLWKRAHFQSKQAVDVATLISTNANTGIYFQFSFCSFFLACSVKRRCRFLLACRSEILKLGTGTSSCQRTLRNCCSIDSIPASSIRWLGASGSARVWERCRWSCCSLKLCVWASLWCHRCFKWEHFNLKAEAILELLLDTMHLLYVSSYLHTMAGNCEKNNNWLTSSVLLSNQWRSKRGHEVIGKTYYIWHLLHFTV